MQTRKVSIKVQHTEISVSAILAPAPTPSTLCPQCGTPWIAGFASQIGTPGLSVEVLRRAVAEDRLHLHCTPANEIWICERTLRRMKETL